MSRTWKKELRKNAGVNSCGVPAKELIAIDEAAAVDNAPFNRPIAWVAALLLLLLAVLAYQPVWHAGFMWDDDDHLTANPCVVGPLGLADIWTSAHARNFPLVTTTFWMEYRLWGLNPHPYHLVNVFMHGLAALVLWRVLLSLKVRAAWLGTALWMLHPVQVESVAWITELKNTQSGVFYLLSILFFCKSKWAEQERPETGRIRLYYTLAMVSGALAVASKSSTVVLPFALGLCAWWIERQWRWRNLRYLTPFLLMSGLAGLLALWTQKLEGAGDGPERALSALERLCVAGKVLWFYLGKLVWPHPLIFIYPRWEIAATSVFAYLPFTGAAVVSVVVWQNRNGWHGRGRAVFLAWSYFVVALLPVLGLINHYFFRYSFVGDHFQYLASIGPLALLGAGIGSVPLVSRKITPLGQRLLCSLLLLALVTLTWRECAKYHDNETLWRTTVAQNARSWIAHNNLGIALEHRGDVDGAVAHYQESILLNPHHAEDHCNLGSALQQQGHLDEAIAHYQEALDIKPDYALAHSGLGIALQQRGDLDEAITHYQKAILSKPDYPDAYYNLGNALQQKGNVDGAITLFRKALELKANYEEAHNNLGVALQQKGSLDEAIAHYQKALDIKPDDAEAYCNLGNVLQQQGDLDGAIARYRKALELKSSYAEAHNNLGVALQQKGQADEAIAHYQRALELIPNLVNAQRALAYLLATSPEARLRNGTKAIELAQRANQLTGGSNPAVLDTLAAAYAEQGRFEEAVETVRQAIERAATQGNSALSQGLQQHLQLYEVRLPFRETH